MTVQKPDRKEAGHSIRSWVTTLDPDTIRRWINYPTDWRFLWSSPGGRPLLGLGCTRVLKSDGLSRTTDLRQKLDKLHIQNTSNLTDRELPRETLPRFFGALSFFRRGTSGTRWDGFPSACFVLPRIQLLEGPDRIWVTVNQTESAGPTEDPETILRQLERFSPETDSSSELNSNPILDREHVPTDGQWMQRVDRMRTKCDTDDLQKIVLAQERELDLHRPVSLDRLSRNITALDNDTFGYLFQSGTGEQFVGSSPERLVSRQGRMVESESLAGTIESNTSIETRDDLADKLSRSTKDQREHGHVVKYLKNRLAPLVSTLETVPQSVRSLPTLQHLLTGFRGKLHSDHHVLELVRELHPTPAVAGRPTGQALSELRDIESFDRGLYAGPIGWFDASGDGEFAVGIRSARLRGSTVNLYAGAGIIPDSEPKNELDELNLKFSSIKSFLDIETTGPDRDKT